MQQNPIAAKAVMPEGRQADPGFSDTRKQLKVDKASAKTGRHAISKAGFPTSSNRGPVTNQAVPDRLIRGRVNQARTRSRARRSRASNKTFNKNSSRRSQPKKRRTEK